MNWLYSFINMLFYALNLAIFIRVIISWFNINPYNPLISFIYQITDPILVPLRRIVPPVGMIDVTPIIALFLLSIVKWLLLSGLSAFIR